MTTQSQPMQAAQATARETRGPAIEVAPDVAYVQDKIVNLYFIGSPDAGDRGWVLVDAGLPGSAHMIKTAAKMRFGSGARPAAIVMTHGHFDHVGALKSLAEAWDAPVYAHVLELPFLDGRSGYAPADPTVGGGAMARLSFAFPHAGIDLGQRIHALPPDGSVPGMLGWRWIHTPGHAPGHVSLFREADRVLIAGDAFVTTRQESATAVLARQQELHGPPAYFTQNWEQARDSVERLAALQPEVAATGHGLPMRGLRMRRDLERLARNFDWLAVPAQGRYVRMPAVYDQGGLVSAPPPVPDPVTPVIVGVSAVALTGAALGIMSRLVDGAQAQQGGVRLKPLRDQVIVITGASSGIGLTTARMAAEHGARLVLAARSEGALRQLTDEIRGNGGEAIYVVADVSAQDDVRQIALAAQASFGGFDTWVNDAGVGMYGKVQDAPIEDLRALFETNFWGVVYGSLEAARHLKHRGGAIINLGSVDSEYVTYPQGMYSATKFAVKAFTDALRMELEHEGAPVSVTLIKPAGIDTPFPMNAKNYMDHAPSLPPPVYAPEVAARAILHTAETPTRDLFVGEAAKGISVMGKVAPRFMDKVVESDAFVGTQQKDGPPRPRDASALDQPSEFLSERGDYEGPVLGRSLYTEAKTSAALPGLALIGVGLTLAMLMKRSKPEAVREADRR